MKPMLLLTTLLLVGCASNSEVVKMGPDTYYLSKQAATGFAGPASLKAEVMKRAGEYCSAQGRSVEVVRAEEAQGPFILGNYPRAEVQFRCVAP